MKAIGSFVALALESGDCVVVERCRLRPSADIRKRNGLQYNSFELGRFEADKNHPVKTVKVLGGEGEND